MSHLLHPELALGLPFIGGQLVAALEQQAEATLKDDPALDPPISLVIRNFNEATQLERLLQDARAQNLGGNKLEIIVVDNESTDNSVAIAKEYDAYVTTIPRKEFTYPHSMNVGMDAASHDAVFLTVAHALLATDLTLHAAARHLNNGRHVAGVFASRVPLPTETASPLERLLGAADAISLFRSPRQIKKAGMGVMGATGAMFSKAVWQELSFFDERYETGGEDTVLAREMLNAHYKIVKDPAMATHHSHGLGPDAMIKEFTHFLRVLRTPQQMEGDVRRRRQARFDR